MSQTVAELLIEIGVEVEGAKKATAELDKVKKASSNTSKNSMASFRKFATTAATSLAGVAAAATAAGVAIFRMVDSSTKALAEVGDKAISSGLGLEQYQRLSAVAKKSGTDIDTLAKGTKKLNMGLAEVAQGGGKQLSNSLSMIGLSAKDLEGLTAQEQLGMIGDALSTYADESDRAIVAAKIFGEEAGPNLLQALNEGSEGINAIADSAKLVFTEEEVEKAQAFQDSLDSLNDTFTKVATEIGIQLAPVVQDIIEKIERWMDENQDLIQQDIPQFIQGIVDVLGDLIPWILDVISEFQNFADELRHLDYYLTENFGPIWEGIKTAMMGLMNPIGAIGEGLKWLTKQFEDFIRKSETLTTIMENLGLLETQSTNVRGAPAFLSAEANAAAAAQALTAPLSEQEQQALNKRVKNNKLENIRQSLVGGKSLKKQAAEAGYVSVESWKKDQSALYGIQPAQWKQLENMGRKPTKPPKGGAGRAAAAGPEPETQIVPLTDFEMLLQQTLGPGFEVRNLPQIRQVELAKEQIKPESIINITNNTFDVTQNITGQADPVAIGKEAAAAIKQEFDIRLSRAGQALGTNVVR